MLKLFQKKSEWIKNRLIQTTAENMPLKDNCITNITVAFGVRNFYDIRLGFKSLHDVLMENGKFTILEFSLPENFFFRAVYRFYFKGILPFAGRLISGDKEAYSYLPESVEEFDRKINLLELLKETGFDKIEEYKLTFGIVQVITAVK